MTKTLLEETTQHFTKRSEVYATWKSPNLTRNVINEDKILEIGCGAKFSFDCDCSEKYGIDVTPTLIKKLRQQDRNINLILADARYLPFKNKTFGSVGAVFVLHHLVANTVQICKCNVEKGLKEMSRVLKDDGQICILEHLSKNDFLSNVMFFTTYILSKTGFQANYLDIHDGVVTYFLSEKTFNGLAKKSGLFSKTKTSKLWQFRKVIFGYDKQLCLEKI